MSRYRYCATPYRLWLLFSLLLAAPSLWAAWPNESNWIELQRNGSSITDPGADGATSRDIVGDATNPASYIFNDGSHLYFRIRVDTDPRQGGGLAPFGWGILIDTDMNSADYEYMIMLDGIVNPEAFYLAKNTTKTYVSDPSDKAETLIWNQLASSDPVSGNYRLNQVDTLGVGAGYASDVVGDGNPDWFIDFRIPYSVLANELGLSDNSLVRFFVGSSNSAQTLSADLVGADLTDLSTPTSPNGKIPTDGTVRFTDAAYSADVTAFQAGNNLYIEVNDQDRNGNSTSLESVTVTLTTPNGDSLVVTLTESSANSGIFVGSVPTESNPIPNTADAHLQVNPVENITVTYIDGVDGTTPIPNQDVPRTDTIQAQPLADLVVSKGFTDPAFATPNLGDNITYRITVTNNGPSDSLGAQVLDLLPSEVGYVKHLPASASYSAATGLWTIGALANGASTTLEIQATVNAAGTPSVINTASIASAAQSDNNTANNSASISFAVAGADLGLTKSVSTATPNSGDTVTFTLTLTNYGKNTANNIVVADALPAGLSYSSHIAGGGSSFTDSADADTVPDEWNITSLATGASITLTLDATVSAVSGATVTNTATIASVAEADPDSTNNTASASVYVGGADLSITKTIAGGAATANEGDTVSYVLTAINNGPNAVTGVQVSDMLPAGVTWSSDTSGGSYDPVAGLWSVGNLASGGTASITISVTVDAGTAGSTITNTASIGSSSGQQDPDTTNNSASSAFSVSYANLAVTKTVDNPVPADGATVTFTLQITNLGNTTATNIQATDYFPSQLDTVTDGGGDGTWVYTAGTHTGSWAIASLAVGATATRTISARVNLGNNDPLSFFNTLNIDAVDQADPVGANNSDSASMRVDAADIQLTKVLATTANPLEGDTVTFTITATNNGPNPATGLTVTDVLPVGLTYASHTVSRGSYNGGSGLWTILTGGDKAFNVGDVATLILNATVDVGTNGTLLTNNVSVSAVDQSDNVSANDAASASVFVGGKDLAMAKSVSNATPNVGETISYTLTVTNSGPSAATGVVVTDLLPAGVTYSSDNGAGAYVSGSGVWTVGALASGASASLQINATVDAASAGNLVTNCATISAYDGLDSITTNNTACQDITVQQVYLTILKDVDNTTPVELADVTYTITINNLGPDTATNLVVTDVIPAAGMTFKSAVPSQGSFVDSDANSIPDQWNIGTLAKSATATLTLTATIKFGTGGTTYNNQACISSVDQSNTNSANSCANVDITPKGVPVLTVVKAADKVNARPGDLITYTVTVTNFSAEVAEAVEVTDLMSNYVGLNIDYNAVGDPFLFVDSGSGLSKGTPSYADASGAAYVPTPGSGFDSAVKSWLLPMTGTMNSGGASFQIKYQIRVD